jgi:Uma2 family endonuclease
MPGSDDVKATSRVKLTYEDFLLFPDDGKRHELIDGEHYVTPSPNTKHQVVLGNVHFMVRTWLESNPVGRVFFAPFDVVFTQFDVVEPDLLYMSNARAETILTSKHVTGAPEIVVEIGSPGTRKLDIVRVYRSDAGRFGKPTELSTDAGDVLTTPVLAGLEMPLVRIFAE